MRRSFALALLAFAACTQQPSVTTSGRAHAAREPAAKGSPGVIQAAVPPGDPHAVDRATTLSDYCVACHPWADDPNSHPVRVSLQAAAAGSDQYHYPPTSPAIVLRDGVWVECSSCHDDGSAGYPFRTVLGDLCAGCHDKGSPGPLLTSIQSPAAGATVSGAIAVTASATGPSVLARAELWGGPTAYEASTLLGTVPSPAQTVSFPVDTLALPDGPYTFLVRVYDVNGTSGTSYVGVTIQNVAPLAVTIQSPASGAVLAGTVSVVALSAGATAADLYDGGTLRASAAPAGDTFTFALDTTALANGAHTLTVQATDGVRTGSASVSVVVQNERPPVSAQIVSPAPDALVRGLLEVVATTANAVAGDLWMLRETGDGQRVASAAVQADGALRFTIDTAAHADGWALLTVDATDGFGVSGQHSIGVVLDNTPPAVAIASPAPGASVRGSVQISAAASDAGGLASVAFYVDGVLLQTVAAPPYAATWTPVRRSGAHALTAVARDLAGNATTSAAVTVYAK